MESKRAMRHGEKLMPDSPGWRSLQEELPDARCFASYAPLRVPGQSNSMASGKGEQAQHGFGRAQRESRMAQQDAIARDRNLGSGNAAAAFSNLPPERTIFGFR